MPKHTMRMTPFQRQVVLGTLLGDSSLRYPTATGNSLLACYHARKQAEWLQQKHQWLTPLSRPITLISQFDKRDGKTRHGSRFHTISTPEFREIALVLYPGKRKTITEAYLEWLTSPVSLACLIGDDGSWDNAGIALATKQFTHEENEILARFLRKRFDISATVQCGDYASVRITAISVAHVKALCAPFLPVSLHYKFGPPEYRTTLVGKKDVICPTCGTTVKDYLSTRRTYCSRACAGLLKPTGYTVRTATRPCDRCGTDFVLYNKRQSRCASCRNVPLHAIPCVICAAPVKKSGRTTCSRSCGVALGHKHRSCVASDEQLGLF